MPRNSLGVFSKACLKIPLLLPTFWKVTLQLMHCLLFSTIKICEFQSQTKKAIQKVRTSWRGEAGSWKNRRKQTVGAGWSNLSVSLLCEKNYLTFQTANRALSDKLLGSLAKSFAVLSLVQKCEVLFINKA